MFTQVVPSLRSPIGVRVAVLLALSLIIASCGGGQDQRLEPDSLAAGIFGGTCVEATDSEVTLYSGRSENLIAPVLEAFTCETGIDVAVRWADSTELALLLDEEGDRTPADLFLSRSPGPVGFLQSKGLLGSVGSDVLDLVEEQNRSADGSWVGVSGRKRVAVYNVDAISDADLPDSILELTDPKWKDRVAIPATNGSFADWFTIFRSQFGTDVATQWINDMAANGARYYPNNRSIVEAASRGEIDLGLVNHYYNYQEAAANGDDHRAANHDLGADDIGGVLIITAGTVIQSSDNVDQANQLLAYMLSEPVQRYVTDDTFEYPLAEGVAPADVLAPLNALEVGAIDFDSLGGGFEETTAIIEASGIANQ